MYATPGLSRIYGIKIYDKFKLLVSITLEELENSSKTQDKFLIATDIFAHLLEEKGDDFDKYMSMHKIYEN